MDLGLKDKVALVTGTGSQMGMGKAIALTLAREGCDIIAADVDLEGAKKTAAEVEALGRRAIAVEADVSNGGQVKEMVKTALAQFGRIDILVNNAGAISGPKTFMELTEADWDNDININYRGVLNCTRAVLDQMISRKSGKIVSISSIGARTGSAIAPVYNGAKAAIIAFTKSLAASVAASGINVNCIAPGLAYTGFGGGAPPPGALERMKEIIPVKRLTETQDIANAVAFLVSDVSSDIVGQTLSVDGGQSMI
jgi:NAD(P)-dependent dehydrogenase (short-subunit alcohol dehydrogenase family)